MFTQIFQIYNVLDDPCMCWVLVVTVVHDDTDASI